MSTLWKGVEGREGLIPRLLTSALACAAAHGAMAATMGCQQLRLVFAPGVTPEIVEREWGSGAARAGTNASLELVGCKGERLDSMRLASPLAKLDPVPLRGAPAPTFLVSADLTADAGSFSGPLTIAVEVVRGRLQPTMAQWPGGELRPIQLGMTGKAAWRRLEGPGGDALVAVRSQPGDAGFHTRYERYDVQDRTWTVSLRSEPGLWESDGDFPPLDAFPPRPAQSRSEARKTPRAERAAEASAQAEARQSQHETLQH